MWEERQAGSGAGSKAPAESRKEEKPTQPQTPKDTGDRRRDRDFTASYRSEIYGKERGGQKSENFED